MQHPLEATVVYRFYIALRDVSPKVWRRVELTAGSSLADLPKKDFQGFAGPRA